MDSPAERGLANLHAARGPDDPTERQELRDEVRITALLLIAHELENISTALITTLDGINVAISAVANLEDSDD